MSRGLLLAASGTVNGEGGGIIWAVQVQPQGGKYYLGGKSYLGGKYYLGGGF